MALPGRAGPRPTHGLCAILALRPGVGLEVRLVLLVPLLQVAPAEVAGAEDAGGGRGVVGVAAAAGAPAADALLPGRAQGAPHGVHRRSPCRDLDRRQAGARRARGLLPPRGVRGLDEAQGERNDGGGELAGVDAGSQPGAPRIQPRRRPAAAAPVREVHLFEVLLVGLPKLGLHSVVPQLPQVLQSSANLPGDGLGALQGQRALHLVPRVASCLRVLGYAQTQPRAAALQPLGDLVLRQVLPGEGVGRCVPERLEVAHNLRCGRRGDGGEPRLVVASLDRPASAPKLALQSLLGPALGLRLSRLGLASEHR
mmetsp:Transcript_85970/g.271022  ORF Transcript_85970/g.271022 Transcript_85970/m.271022 type:complete len:312 (-) Transcript_85970:116-1051(-)